jgi:orotidine-5'-phosphate decarboxylase
VYRVVVPVKGSLRLLAVTVLTSVDEAEVREMGWSGAVEELVSLRAYRAIEAGIDGLICSGQEAARLRRELGSGPLIITPGIRAATERGSDDQKRTMTLADAFQNGADHIVVGRPIRNAPNPRMAAQAMQDEIAALFAGRGV